MASIRAQNAKYEAQITVWPRKWIQRIVEKMFGRQAARQVTNVGGTISRMPRRTRLVTTWQHDPLYNVINQLPFIIKRNLRLIKLCYLTRESRQARQYLFTIRHDDPNFFLSQPLKHSWNRETNLTPVKAASYKFFAYFPASRLLRNREISYLDNRITKLFSKEISLINAVLFQVQTFLKFQYQNFSFI